MTAPFRYETDLADPTEAFFRVRLGERDFAHELDGCRTAPDLVAASRAPGFARRRVGPPPVTVPLQLRLLRFLSEPRSEAELRAWAPWGWRDLRARALRPALERGLVFEEDGVWRAVTVPAPYADLVAIELKLRDWRKGIRQARRNQVFASASWLVMPPPLPDDAAALAAAVGVGLVALAVDGRAETVVEAASRPPLSPFAAALFGELVLEQTLEDQAERRARPFAGSPRARPLAATA